MSRNAIGRAEGALECLGKESEVENNQPVLSAGQYHASARCARIISIQSFARRLLVCPQFPMYAPDSRNLCPRFSYKPSRPNVLPQPGRKYVYAPVASAILTHVNLPSTHKRNICNPTSDHETVKRTACMIGPADHERPPAK